MNIRQLYDVNKEQQVEKESRKISANTGNKKYKENMKKMTQGIADIEDTGMEEKEETRRRRIARTEEEEEEDMVKKK